MIENRTDETNTKLLLSLGPHSLAYLQSRSFSQGTNSTHPLTEAHLTQHNTDTYVEDPNTEVERLQEAARQFGFDLFFTCFEVPRWECSCYWIVNYHLFSSGKDNQKWIDGL